MSADLLTCPFCDCSMSVSSNRDWHRLVGEHDDACFFAVDADMLIAPATDDQLATLVSDWNRRAALAAKTEGALYGVATSDGNGGFVIKQAMAVEPMPVAYFVEGYEPRLNRRDFVSLGHEDFAIEALGRIVPAATVVPDYDEDAFLIDRLGKLLAGVAVALKGPEPALTRWSYHDLPEIAATLMLELEIYRATAAPAVQQGGDA